MIELTNLRRLHKGARERVVVLGKENKELKIRVTSLEGENKELRRELSDIKYQLSELQTIIFKRRSRQNISSFEDDENGQPARFNILTQRQFSLIILHKVSNLQISCAACC